MATSLLAPRCSGPRRLARDAARQVATELARGGQEQAAETSRVEVERAEKEDRLEREIAELEQERDSLVL